jgi:hypothetical protein
VAPELGRAQFDTIRLRLLKVAAQVRQSVRRIVVALPSAFGLACATRAHGGARAPPLGRRRRRRE